MGQQEIINFLEKHKNQEFTTTEISKLIGLGSNSIKVTIRSLLKDPFVELEKRTLSFEEKKQRFNNVVNTKIFVYRLKKFR